MPVTLEFNDDNKVVSHHDASGRLLWNAASGVAPQQRIETRHDAVDGPGGLPAAGAGGIRSGAQFRRALGVPEPRQPRGRTVNPVEQRYDSPAAAMVGPVRSAAELRRRLGMAAR